MSDDDHHARDPYVFTYPFDILNRNLSLPFEIINLRITRPQVNFHTGRKPNEAPIV